MAGLIVPRQRELLRVLWRAGRLSRRELHQQTGVRPNTIGSDVAALIRAGLVRECASSASVRGRPRVPLEIDPVRRHVVGVAIRPGYVQLARLNLAGQIIEEPVMTQVSEPQQIIAATRNLLAEHIDRRTLGIGLSTPGFVDPVQRSMLFSSAIPSGGPYSLQPAYEAAGKLPLILENDMHALAARWLLTRQTRREEDVLLVYFDDDVLGAALLIEGRPNRGCVTGANELGHTRMPIETKKCYCGHTGCLERICSSDFLSRNGSANGTLAERAAKFDGDDAAMRHMIDLLAMGLANAVNFTRVNRLVLVSTLTRHPAFADAITTGIRRRLLGQLAERVNVDQWDHPSPLATAETTGWLALASLYHEGWMPEEVSGVRG